MLRIIGVALAMLLATVGSVQAVCTNPIKPRPMSVAEFMATPFGTLAFRYNYDRFLPFERMGCFDVSSFGLGNRRLYINSTTTEQEATYLAAVVSRPFPGEQAGVPMLSLELFRNGSANGRSDVWIDAQRDEPSYRRGTLIGGAEFHVLRADYDSQAIDVGAAGGYAGLPISGEGADFETWHALLSEVPGSVDPQEGFPVLANSREAITTLTENIEALKTEGVATLRTKAYLVKFLASPAPSFDRPILEPGAAGCLYIDYRVGGESEPPIDHSGSDDILVLRMDEDARC